MQSRSELQDVLGASEPELARWGYLFGFGFPHPPLYNWAKWQVCAEGNLIWKGKGHFLLLSYTLAQLAVWFQACGMCTRAAYPSCPDTWLHTALRQVFGSVPCGHAQSELAVSRRVQGQHSQNTLGNILEATTGWMNGGNREGNKCLTAPEDANNKVWW